jgi:hypothetical protein
MSEAVSRALCPDSAAPALGVLVVIRPCVLKATFRLLRVSKVVWCGRSGEALNIWAGVVVDGGRAWGGGQIRQRRRLVHVLRSKLWLLVPEDQGREQMAGLVRLFDPAARLAGAGRISVDAERRIYLTRPVAIDPGAAAEARVPPGLRVAYFVQLQGRSAPLDMGAIEREKQKLRDSAILLLNGLAVRLSGTASPVPAVLNEPLEVRVYLPKALSAAEVAGVAGRFIPGLAAEENVTLGSVGANLWRTAAGDCEVEFWPGKAADFMTINPPVILGEWRFRPQLECAVLRLAGAANQANPRAARMVGQAALAVAAAAGGVCGSAAIPDAVAGGPDLPAGVEPGVAGGQKILSHRCSVVCPRLIAAPRASSTVAASLCPMP